MTRSATLPTFLDDDDDERDETVSSSWSIPAEGRPREFSVRCPECDAELFVSRRTPSTPPESGVRPLSFEVCWEAPVEKAVRYATSVAENTPLSALPELFLRTMARVLVIVDERRRPLGVVSPSHVLRAVGDRPKEELDGITALDISTSGGALLPERSTLRTAAKRLSVEDREYIVVITEDGRLAGLLTPSDVIAALVDEFDDR